MFQSSLKLRPLLPQLPTGWRAQCTNSLSCTEFIHKLPFNPHQCNILALFFLCFTYLIFQVLQIPYPAKNTILLFLQLQFLMPGLTVDCLKTLLDILCDSTHMSHPLTDLMLLCDLKVTHTHFYEGTHGQPLRPSDSTETALLPPPRLEPHWTAVAYLCHTTLCGQVPFFFPKHFPLFGPQSST